MENEKTVDLYKVLTTLCRQQPHRAAELIFKELIKKETNILIDGEKVTKEEAKAIYAFVRYMRNEKQ